MKKLLLTLTTVVAAGNLLAQGTAGSSLPQGLVNFSNDGNTRVLTPGGAQVRLSDQVVVNLYWGATADEGSMTVSPEQATGVPRNIQVGFPNLASFYGRFSGGSHLAGAAAGDTVYVQVRAWSTALGHNTYEDAVAAQNPDVWYGASTPISLKTGGSGSPAEPAASLILNGFQGFSLVSVPEPSALAFGLLGAGALLLLRRRK